MRGIAFVSVSLLSAGPSGSAAGSEELLQAAIENTIASASTIAKIFFVIWFSSSFCGPLGPALLSMVFWEICKIENAFVHGLPGQKRIASALPPELHIAMPLIYTCHHRRPDL